MGRFRFRLESIRKLRENQEKEALRMLSEAQANLYQKTLYRDQLVRRDGEVSLNREALSHHTAKSSAYAIHDTFTEGNKVRILQAENEIRRAQRSLEKMTLHYMQTRRKKKMIEEIRNKDLQKFKKEERKKEQKQMDDLTVMRWRLGKGTV